MSFNKVEDNSLSIVCKHEKNIRYKLKMLLQVMFGKRLQVKKIMFIKNFYCIQAQKLVINKKRKKKLTKHTLKP